MLAEILAAHWPAYAAQFGRLIPPEQRAAVRAIQRCRTPALGGQLYRCGCGREHYAYHSCNHRACRRCGLDDAAAWLAAQRTRLLPVPYFLVTLTVPAELREPIRAARTMWYGALLKASAGALQDLAAQPKHLGAELGITAVLQTWTRDLRYHPHVHLLVPGGGLTADQLRWVRVPKDEFLVPQVKLAARFKGRLKAWLRQEQPTLFRAVPAKVWWMKWVADVQPVGSGEADNGGAVPRTTVSGSEFVRRVLQHVLPKGFQRVRHYGWLGAAAQAKRERIGALLDWRAPLPQLSPFNSQPPKCPGCGQVMRLIGSVARKPP
jgi:hypothetical protein